MNLDIATAIGMAFFLLLVGVLFSLYLGIRALVSGKKLLYFRKRREMVARGWRLITRQAAGAGVGLRCTRCTTRG